jgi:hypothetical protein
MRERREGRERQGVRGRRGWFLDYRWKMVITVRSFRGQGAHGIREEAESTVRQGIGERKGHEGILGMQTRPGRN